MVGSATASHPDTLGAATIPDVPRFTLAEAAELLGVGTANLRMQIRAGRLVAVKLGRAWVIDAAELERYRVDSLGRPGRKRKQPPPAPAELTDDGGPDLRPSLGAGKGRLQMDGESDAARRFLLGALLALLALSLIFVAINAILEARA